MKGFKPFQVCLDIQHTDFPKIMDYKSPVTINQDVHLEHHVCFITTLVTMTCGFVLVYIIYSVLVCLTICQCGQCKLISCTMKYTDVSQREVNTTRHNANIGRQIIWDKSKAPTSRRAWW